MERRSSCPRSICAPTVASRIAVARNKRETLLLAEARKGLLSKKDGTIRNFHREKAKENNFLQNIRRRSFGMLIAAERDQHGEAGADDKISSTRTRNAMIDQKARRQSLEVFQTSQMQERIQEFITRGLPGGKSTAKQDGHFKEKSIKNEAVQKNFDVPETERSLDESKRIDASTLIPFKIRSRTSGVCFSHSHCQHLHLPPINLPDLRRKCSGTQCRRNSFVNFSKRRYRKLRTPTVAGGFRSKEHQKRMTSKPLINTQREAIKETSREV